MGSRKLKSKTIQTEIISNAKLFNAGIRKHTDSLRHPHFIENITQALLYSVNLKDAWVLIGGDGRTYCKDFIERMMHVLAGNSVRRVFVCLNGCIPTSVAAYVLRSRHCHLGFVITGGHYPPGNNGYLGLKIISPPGIPIRGEVVDKANRIIKSLQSFSACEKISFDFSTVGERENVISGRNFSIQVIDIIAPYVDAAKKMFDFPSIKEYIQNDFKLLINCCSGVTGSIVKRIFVEELGISDRKIINSVSLEDFGRLSSDPNPLNYKDFVNCVKEREYNFGAVISPDGCRCMIIGEEGFVVPPSDSLAIIAAKNRCIRFFRENKLETVVRTICTSHAIDRVSDSLSLLQFEVPVGWQNFSSAMLPASGKSILFGEESYGLGISSDSFCGDRDGIWTTLAWLSILTECKMSVKEVTEEHWKTFGRSYFGRLDFLNIPHQLLDTFLCFFREKNSLRFEKIKSGSFVCTEYVDPIGIDPKLQTEEAKKRNTEIVFDIENYVYPYGFIKKSLLRDDQYQIYQIYLMEDARLVLRKSESTHNSSTLRFYIDYRVDPEDANLFEDREEKSPRAFHKSSSENNEDRRVYQIRLKPCFYLKKRRNEYFLEDDRKRSHGTKTQNESQFLGDTSNY